MIYILILSLQKIKVYTKHILIKIETKINFQFYRKNIKIKIQKYYQTGP